MIGSVLDHNAALEYVLQNYNNEEITQKDVLTIHKILMKKLLPKSVGEYRKTNVGIYGVTFFGDRRLIRKCPNPELVPGLMDKLFEDIYKLEESKKSGGSIWKELKNSHFEFEYIHPFIDGNGRTGRLFLNMLLLRNDYKFKYILDKNKQRYYSDIAEYVDEYYPEERIPCIETVALEDLNKIKTKIKKND